MIYLKLHQKCNGNSAGAHLLLATAAGLAGPRARVLRGGLPGSPVDVMGEVRPKEGGIGTEPLAHVCGVEMLMAMVVVVVVVSV